MKPKRQHKFQSEAELLKAIDRAHRKIDKLLSLAQIEPDSEALARGCDTTACRLAREQADLLLGKIKRLRETRLVKLGNALAAIRTIPIGEDNGISGLNETQVVLESK